MADRYFDMTGGHLTCTANDVRIASASNIRSIDGTPLGTCVSGKSFSFIADFTVQTTATARYDIGLYFGTDGDPNKDGALSGTCGVNIITKKDPYSLNPTTALGSSNFVQLDQSPDTCGDINTPNNPQIVTVRVDNVVCQDSDGDGLLNLPNCTSWRQTGANGICTSYLDTYPGSPSKCNCDIAFNIGIRVEAGKIAVTKSVDPVSRPEPGGLFTFTVTATNTGEFQAVILDRICDDQFGTVAYSQGPNCAAGTLGNVISTTCALPQTLAVNGGSYSCTFTAAILPGGPATVTDTVTVYGHDQNIPPKPISGEASAQVVISDVPPAATVVKTLVGLECADINYRVKVTNADTAESIWLKSLSDSGFGDITKVQGNVLATNCTAPIEIAKGSFYECDFRAHICGGSHTNTVTGTVYDNEKTEINQPSNALTVNVGATTPGGGTQQTARTVRAVTQKK